MFPENQDCVPGEPRLCSWRTKIVFLENLDCVPGEPRLCFRRTKIVFPENRDCVPGEPRLCSRRTTSREPEGLPGFVNADLRKITYNGSISVSDPSF